MARYRIEFSNEWVRGRWGFIDRAIFHLGGKEKNPSALENTWMVEFRGRPRALGDYMIELLKIKPEHFDQFGTIFEITEVASPRKKVTRIRSRGSTDERKKIFGP